MTTLGQLKADAEQAGIGSSTILIVGDVLKGVAAACQQSGSGCFRSSRCLRGMTSNRKRFSADSPYADWYFHMSGG